VASHKGEKFLSARVSVGTTASSRDSYRYATITVKRPYLMVEQRLHTYRTNWTLHCLLQTPWPETGDYNGVMGLCQAQVSGSRLQDNRIHMIIMIILKIL